MEREAFVQWLIEEKKMSTRSEKDVISRCGRIDRMLEISEFNCNTMEQLVGCEKFQQSTMFIKSQLKRALTLYLEYTSQQGEQ